MTSYHAHKHQKARKIIAIKKSIKPRLIDRLIYVAAIVEPLFSLPQAIEVYRTKSAGSVSVLSWLGFEVMTLIWIWYAVVHKERMILIYQTLFFVIDGAVLAGAIYYGGRLL
jgi:uncharacterized protein with PQ loop repeat